MTADIVVIASRPGAAWKLACLVEEGVIPACYESVDAAVEWADRTYPPPQQLDYQVFRFEKVGDDLLIRESRPLRT